MRAIVSFSHNILDTALQRANWFVRRTNVLRAVDAATVQPGGDVRLQTSVGAADTGPDVVSYSPPPFDVVSDTAVQVPAEAFADFPLV